MIENKKQWCIDQHERVNHFYGEYPYKLHLDAVATVHKQFQDEAPEDILYDVIDKACYGHDLEEDTRLTFNNIVSELGLEAAEIVHALTNSKGRTRAERADRNYYLNIRQTPGAAFVKMCDRIANVRFSRLTGSSMFEKYRDENKHFITAVSASDFPRMRAELKNMFK